jgi:hypothetical protein
MTLLWFFLVFGLGAHNGHSYVARAVLGQIVQPSKEACEAARRGVQESAAGEDADLYDVGPCQPLVTETERGPERTN